MEIIKRNRYLDAIAAFIDKPVIKIMTGMRRVGKSTLLLQIKEEILSSVTDEQKIYINFESYDLLNIQNDLDLKDYLAPYIKDPNKKLYFFFDEIQLVKGWERVINALRVNDKYDIFIAGSNSNIISSELSTVLAGRYVEFEIQPFVFKEFASQYAPLGMSKDDLFQKFIKFGGMPSLNYFNFDASSIYMYLNDIYNTIVVKDVMRHYSIRDIDTFNRVMLFVMDNTGQAFSATYMHKYFKSEKRDISVNTILNYLKSLKQAYILQAARRFDTRCKKILDTDEKYYLTDHGFRAAVGYCNERDIERVLENIVYIELVSRGYSVSVGRINTLEIDFVATKGKEINYYQICYLLDKQSTRDREFGVLNKIKDNYPKYVLSMDKNDFSQDGIIHKNIIDFLLME